MAETTDQIAFRSALTAVPSFVYGNALRLVVLSVAWVICLLPVITVGPATLLAYAAVQDLRSERNAVDASRLGSVLRRNGVASVIFSGVPVVFGGISVLYGIPALSRSMLLGEIIALIAGYIAMYSALVLVPTFSAMARGVSPVSALRYGIRWVASHPTAVLSMALLTVVTFAVTALLMVAFPLLFAGIAFSLHVIVTDEFDTYTDENGRASAPAAV
ncbi:hypothetical protein V5735_20500 (plasmid) [Haladaptatus sp. SPP-AMP-3]|uniref:hypothetical protein n=1 Tax=Haladaptatus sp. SPP-AMP-3 TaxID=3121295 RepID=UPI003C30E069